MSVQEDKRRLGRIAYEAYCQETGWKSAITGADLPPFYNTPEIVQTAWMRAVHAILMEVVEICSSEYAKKGNLR